MALLPIAYCLLPIAYCRCLLPIAYCFIAGFLPTAYCYCLLLYSKVHMTFSPKRRSPTWRSRPMTTRRSSWPWKLTSVSMMLRGPGSIHSVQVQWHLATVSTHCINTQQTYRYLISPPAKQRQNVSSPLVRSASGRAILLVLGRVPGTFTTHHIPDTHDLGLLPVPRNKHLRKCWGMFGHCGWKTTSCPGSTAHCKTYGTRNHTWSTFLCPINLISQSWKPPGLSSGLGIRLKRCTTKQYICIHIYENVYVCIYLYIYIYVCTYVYIYVYIYGHIYIYMYICICFLYIHMYIHIWECIYAYICIYVYIYINIYICIYIQHTYIHTSVRYWLVCVSDHAKSNV